MSMLIFLCRAHLKIQMGFVCLMCCFGKTRMGVWCWSSSNKIWIQMCSNSSLLLELVLLFLDNFFWIWGHLSI
jgi:hypothetical protein